MVTSALAIFKSVKLKMSHNPSKIREVLTKFISMYAFIFYLHNASIKLHCYTRRNKARDHLRING